MLLRFLAVQLRSFIEAGFPIVEAWRLVSLSTNHRRLRRICFRIHRDLAEGKSFADALRPHRGVLPPYFVTTLAAGERGGAYAETLVTLESHYAWLADLRRDMRSSLNYMLGCLLLGLLIFAIRDCVLAGIPDEGGTINLPPGGISEYSWIFLGYFGPVPVAWLAAYLLTGAMAESRTLRRPLDVFALSMPGFGSVIRRYCVANFCRMYATLQGAGLHPSNVYETAANSMGNTHLESRLLRWRKFVDHGEPVIEALKRTGAIPRDTLSIIETSEMSSSTVQVLPRIAELETESLRYQMKMLLKAIQPAAPFVILLGLFILPMTGSMFPYHVRLSVIFFLWMLV